MHPWLDCYISDKVVSFPGDHIRRHMISECPSLMMLISMTRSRHCPVSPLYRFYFPHATIKQHVEKYFETMQWSCSSYNFPLRPCIHWWFLTETVFTMMLGKWWLPMPPHPSYLSVGASHSPISQNSQWYCAPCYCTHRYLFYSIGK